MENTYEFFDEVTGLEAITDEDLQRLLRVDHEENPNPYMSLCSPYNPQQNPNLYMPQSSLYNPQQNPNLYMPQSSLSNPQQNPNPYMPQSSLSNPQQNPNPYMPQSLLSNPQQNPNPYMPQSVLSNPQQNPNPYMPQSLLSNPQQNPNLYMPLSSPSYSQPNPNLYMPLSSPSNSLGNPDAFLLGVDGINLSPEVHQSENPNYLVVGDNSPDLEGDVNLQVENGPRIPEREWQRIKWTNDMVKLLISIVSYIGLDVASSSSNNPSHEGSHLLTPVKGKWRAISNILVGRGFRVSPQQCEDKFNNLYKKFKRLNDVLGRFNASTAVKNPLLLECMNVPNKAKAEVSKILSSKQLFFPEMCSYYDGNRIHLPHDEHLQKSVQDAVKGKTIYKYSKEVHDKFLEKRLRRREDGDSIGIDQSCQPGNEPIDSEWQHDDMNPLLQSRLSQLKEKRLHIEEGMLEVNQARFQWLTTCEEKDQETHQRRIQNELMKLENERMKLAFESQETGRGPT